MSIIVDPEVSEAVDEVDVVDINEAEDQVTDEAPKGEAEEQPTEEEDGLPDKFKGKSPAEIASAYENLERELGRKGQEIGELRKLTDQILQSQISQQAQPEEPEVDFYDDPEAAVKSILDKDPRFKELEQQTQMQQAQMSIQQLQQAHPDYMDVVQAPDFQEWVAGSKVRQQLFRAADSYDFESADVLLSDWKERQLVSKTKEVEANEEAKRKQALKTGKGVSKASGESTAGKKVYRRADLIRLKTTDPARYDALQDEILAAYAEGRVK